GEVQQTRLRRPIADVADIALMPLGRPDIDDAAAAPALDHGTGYLLGEQQRAAKAHVQLPPEFVRRYIEQAFADLQGCAIDEHVDRPERCFGLDDRGAALVLPRDITRPAHCSRSAITERARTRLRVARQPVHADELGTFL